MSHTSGDREWRWDGERWEWWNGYSWQEGDPEDPHLPPPPDDHHQADTHDSATTVEATDQAPSPPPARPATPPPPPAPTAPPPQAPPPQYIATTGAAAGSPAARRWGPGAIIAMVAIGAVVVLAVLGGGLFLLTRSGGDDVVTVETEPLGVQTDPFTQSVGTDVPVTPVSAPAATASSAATAATVSGGQAGLYGGTLNTQQCDKDKLVAFLAANPDKAAAWAGVQGIQTTQIASFVAGLTPMLLRTDTMVINHGFTNGRANPYTSVLQAGTAVMVNNYGVPVVKCNCGNPLKPMSAPPKRVKYQGARWPGFSTAGFTVIQSSTVIIQNFTVTNITNNTTFTRPTGTNGGQDQPGGGQTTASPTPPQPTPTLSTPPQPTPTLTGGGDSGDTGKHLAVQYVSDALDVCASSYGVGLIGVAQNPQKYNVQTTSTGYPNMYRVSVTDPDSGETLVWTVDTSTGNLTPGSQLTAEFTAEFCPNMRSG